jgi:hypothetical protein
LKFYPGTRRLRFTKNYSIKVDKKTKSNNGAKEKNFECWDDYIECLVKLVDS